MESSWLVHSTDWVRWSFSYSNGQSIPSALWRRLSVVEATWSTVAASRARPVPRAHPDAAASALLQAWHEQELVCPDLAAGRVVVRVAGKYLPQRLRRVGLHDRETGNLLAFLAVDRPQRRTRRRRSSCRAVPAQAIQASIPACSETDPVLTAIMPRVRCNV
jgi:hypothetical protein